MTGSRGTSLPEALVTLLLGVFLVHLAIVTVQRLARFQERAMHRQDVVLATRIARTALRGELARSGAAWTAAGDSIRLRAFRGTGVVCPTRPAPDALVVAYAGDRRADPLKDSVEVVALEGHVTVVDLRWAGPASVVSVS